MPGQDQATPKRWPSAQEMRQEQFGRVVELMDDGAAAVSLMVRLWAPDLADDWEAIRSEQAAFLRRVLDKVGADDA